MVGNPPYNFQAPKIVWQEFGAMEKGALDRPLDKRGAKEVSMSAFAYLFSAIIQVTFFPFFFFFFSFFLSFVLF
jgi:hypothetical protein